MEEIGNWHMFLKWAADFKLEKFALSIFELVFCNMCLSQFVIHSLSHFVASPPEAMSIEHPSTLYI